MSSTPALNFSNSDKRSLVSSCAGFIYHFNRTRPKIKYSSCKGRVCSTQIHRDHNNLLVRKSVDDIYHLPLPECIEVAAFKEEFKERALSEATPIGKIHDIVLYLNYADPNFIDAISNKNESSFNLITLFIVDISTRRHFLLSTFALSTSHSVDIVTVDHSLCRHFVRRRKNLSTINFSTKICRHYVLDIFLSTFGYFPWSV